MLSYIYNNVCRHVGKAWSFLLLLMAACANPGAGPDGGPYDETPPQLLGTSPQMGARNIGGQKITLVFNEAIQVENAVEKVIVSPPQVEMPEIKVSGRRITVSLLDSLKPGTTYTVDFSDAIKDATEGNPMGNFTYYFSTGETVDTMEVAGHVFSADNLTPIKGILVGLHSALEDSVFRTRAFDRVARTNAEGFFSIKGVSPGRYRAYALMDMDGDFRFSGKGEMIAFSQEIITPSSFPDVRHDTLWVDSVRYDSVRVIPYTHYQPDNLELRAFKEAGQPRALLKIIRDVPEKFTAYFTAPSAEAPTVSGFGFDATATLMESRSQGNDTITYWVRDTALLARDTLHFAYIYEATDDSTGLACLRTDTFELVPKLTMARRLKQKAEAMERWQKQQERLRKRGKSSNEEPPRDYVKFTGRVRSSMAPDQNISFTLSEPASIDTAGIHLLLTVDSTKTESPFRLVRDKYNMLRYTLYGEWRPGQRYELLIDSAAVRSIYDNVNKPFNQSFSISPNEEFAALFVHVPQADTSLVVQLLASETKVERQVRVKSGRADFYYIEPGTYYLRAFRDFNNNDRWDSGLFDEGLQAETVYYYPKTLKLRANWDIEETWHLDALPAARQKPAELRNQQKERKQSGRSRNAERVREKAKQSNPRLRQR